MQTMSAVICEFITKAYPRLKDLSIEFIDAFLNTGTNRVEFNCYDDIRELPIILKIATKTLEYWDGSFAAVDRILLEALQEVEETKSTVEPLITINDDPSFYPDFDYLDIYPVDSEWTLTQNSYSFPEVERIVNANDAVLIETQPVYTCGFYSDWNDYIDFNF